MEVESPAVWYGHAPQGVLLGQDPQILTALNPVPKRDRFFACRDQDFVQRQGLFWDERPQILGIEAPRLVLVHLDVARHLLPDDRQQAFLFSGLVPGDHLLLAVDSGIASSLRGQRAGD